MKIRLSCASLIVALGLARGAHASVYSEFTGARSVAMGGAHRGLGSSNETILLNPAGMAVGRRYSIDLQYAYGSSDRLSDLNTSAVDSKTADLAGGLAYTRAWGDPSAVDAAINRIALGVAYPLSPAIAVGVTAKHLRGSYSNDAGRQNLATTTATAGALISFGMSVSLGLTYENFIKDSYETQNILIPQAGAGLSIHSPLWAVAADVIADTRANITKRYNWHVGAEYFAFNVVALRGGFHTEAADRTLGPNAPTMNVVSGGIGFINESAGINVGLQRSLSAEPRYTFIGGLQFFM